MLLFNATTNNDTQTDNDNDNDNDNDDDNTIYIYIYIYLPGRAHGPAAGRAGLRAHSGSAPAGAVDKLVGYHIIVSIIIR